MNWNEILPIVTPVVAVYGALLSTYNLIMQRSQTKRWANVSMSLGYATGNGAISEAKLIITVANPANRPIQISTIGALLPDNKQLLFPITQPHLKMPVTLAEGHSTTSMADALDIGLELSDKYGKNVELRPYAVDGVGKRHVGKKFVFELESVLPENRKKLANA